MLRFTTRELLLLTVIVALALGWGISSANWDRRMRLTKRHAEALRMAFYNAEQNHEDLMDKLGSEANESLLLPVDWELATREIP